MVVAIPETVFNREQQNTFLRGLRWSFPVLFFYAAPNPRTSVNFVLGVHYGCVWLLIRARPD